LVTTPLMVCGRPFVEAGQFLVTLMQGDCATTHVFVAEAVTRVPQMLSPDALTTWLDRLQNTGPLVL
jgi:hypothetical protein